jgi:putative ABC transport system permease protein
MRDSQKNIPDPPQFATRFLRWFCAEALEEEIAGDLLEAYYYRVDHKGIAFARRMYILDVIRFFRPYAFEKYSRSKQFIPMWTNYIKIAFRNLLRKKGSTVINLGGLTLALSVVLLVGLFLDHHLSYDQHYPNADRTYRLENDFRSQLYAPFRFEEYYRSDRATQLRNKMWLKSFSQIDQVAYLLQSDAAISRQAEYFLEYEGRELIVEQVLFTNTAKSLLEIFPQEFIYGEPSQFRSDFQKVVITEALAERMFGVDWRQRELLGQPLIMEAENLENSNYTIAGVIADPIESSHFTFNMIVNGARIPSWGAYTYFTTQEGTNADELLTQLNGRYVEIEPDYGNDERYKGVRLQNIQDIHTSEDDLLYELRAKIDPTILSIFAVVAIVILLITWTNYMNLSIAIYWYRQKEIGMRKVLGARRLDIAMQLLVEVILVALLALPIAIMLVFLLLPVFSELMNLNIPQTSVFSCKVLLGISILTLLTGVISGLYPALIFSRRSMLNLFRSRIGSISGNYRFGVRRVLVGLQFMMLVALISITGYIFQQLQYIQSRDLGFEDGGVITIPAEGIDQHRDLKSILAKDSKYEYIGTGRVPGTNKFNQTTYLLKGYTDIFDDANVINADYWTMKAIGIDHPALEAITEGKEEVALINRAMAERLMSTYNLTESELMGMTLVDEPEYTDEETGEYVLQRKIEGILPDMHYFSLRHQIEPMIFNIVRDRGWAFNSVIKIKKGADIRDALTTVEEAYYKAGNERPFEFTFLDSQINDLYKADQRNMWLMTVLSSVAIFLSIMGLIGLVSFITYTRKKEIGIRKVFGANVVQILLLINKEFLVLMSLAILLATPLIYYATNQWLENFSYRIGINPTIILLSGFVATAIVVLVVSLQSRRTAETNPTSVLVEE